MWYDELTPRLFASVESGRTDDYIWHRHRFFLGIGIVWTGGGFVSEDMLHSAD